VFRWERVELNLPGHEDCAPHKSWVSKRRSDGSLAADSISFVDDIRPTGPTEADARQASQVMAKQAAWCGIQDATRKQRLLMLGLALLYTQLTVTSVLWLSKPSG
jgi:hypothetical protein